MTAQQLRLDRRAIAEQMKNVLNSSATHDIKMARWKALDVKQEALRVQIEAAEAAERRQSYQLPGHDGSRAEHLPGTRALSPSEQFLDSPEYRAAFETYARTANKAELRALGSGSGADGAQLVPTGFQREIEVYLSAIGGLRQCARVVPTATGNNLPWPTEIDTSNGLASGTFNAGSWLAESAGNSEVDPTYGAVTLYADLLDSGLVLVPIELMQDSAFSMEGELSRTFGTRLGRGTAQAYMNGNGLQITGLLPELVAAGGREVLAVGAFANSGNSADTDLNGLGSDDFASAIAAVNPAYRTGKGVGFIANQQTFDSLRKVKDKYGRPIWETSLTQGQPDTIFGYPYWFDQSMQTPGAGNKSLIFGNFNHYVIRDVLGMTMIRYNELYMGNRQIGFEAYMRTFGKTLNPQAFAYVQHPLS